MKNISVKHVSHIDSLSDVEPTLTKDVIVKNTRVEMLQKQLILCAHQIGVNKTGCNLGRYCSFAHLSDQNAQRLVKKTPEGRSVIRWLWRENSASLSCSSCCWQPFSHDWEVRLEKAFVRVHPGEFGEGSPVLLAATGEEMMPVIESEELTDCPKFGVHYRVEWGGVANTDENNENCHTFKYRGFIADMNRMILTHGSERGNCRIIQRVCCTPEPQWFFVPYVSVYILSNESPQQEAKQIDLAAASVLESYFCSGVRSLFTLFENGVPFSTDLNRMRAVRVTDNMVFVLQRQCLSVKLACPSADAYGVYSLRQTPSMALSPTGEVMYAVSPISGQPLPDQSPLSAFIHPLLVDGGIQALVVRYAPNIVGVPTSTKLSDQLVATAGNSCPDADPRQKAIKFSESSIHSPDNVCKLQSTGIGCFICDTVGFLVEGIEIRRCLSERFFTLSAEQLTEARQSVNTSLRSFCDSIIPHDFRATQLSHEKIVEVLNFALFGEYLGRQNAHLNYSAEDISASRNSFAVSPPQSTDVSIGSVSFSGCADFTSNKKYSESMNSLQARSFYQRYLLHHELYLHGVPQPPSQNLTRAPTREVQWNANQKIARRFRSFWDESPAAPLVVDTAAVLHNVETCSEEAKWVHSLMDNGEYLVDNCAIMSIQRFQSPIMFDRYLRCRNEVFQDVSTTVPNVPNLMSEFEDDFSLNESISKSQKKESCDSHARLRRNTINRSVVSSVRRSFFAGDDGSHIPVVTDGVEAFDAFQMKESVGFTCVPRRIMSRIFDGCCDRITLFSSCALAMEASNIAKNMRDMKLQDNGASNRDNSSTKNDNKVDTSETEGNSDALMCENTLTYCKSGAEEVKHKVVNIDDRSKNVSNTENSLQVNFAEKETKGAVGGDQLMIKKTQSGAFKVKLSILNPNDTIVIIPRSARIPGADLSCFYATSYLPRSLTYRQNVSHVRPHSHGMNLLNMDEVDPIGKGNDDENSLEDEKARLGRGSVGNEAGCSRENPDGDENKVGSPVYEFIDRIVGEEKTRRRELAAKVASALSTRRNKKKQRTSGSGSHSESSRSRARSISLATTNQGNSSVVSRRKKSILLGRGSPLRGGVQQETEYRLLLICIEFDGLALDGSSLTESGCFDADRFGQQSRRLVRRTRELYPQPQMLDITEMDLPVQATEPFTRWNTPPLYPSSLSSAMLMQSSTRGGQSDTSSLQGMSSIAQNGTSVSTEGTRASSIIGAYNRNRFSMQTQNADIHAVTSRSLQFSSVVQMFFTASAEIEADAARHSHSTLTNLGFDAEGVGDLLQSKVGVNHSASSISQTASSERSSLLGRDSSVTIAEGDEFLEGITPKGVMSLATHYSSLWYPMYLIMYATTSQKEYEVALSSADSAITATRMIKSIANSSSSQRMSDGTYSGVTNRLSRVKQQKKLLVKKSVE